MADDMKDDAAIGRFVIDYRDNKARLAALRTAFAQTAGALRELSDGLMGNPQLLDFGDGALASDLMAVSSAGSLELVADVHAIDLKLLDAAALRSQVDEYRTLKKQVDDSVEQIKGLGLTP